MAGACAVVAGACALAALAPTAARAAAGTPTAAQRTAPPTVARTSAAQTTPARTTASVTSLSAPNPNTPVLVSDPHRPPRGYRLTAAEVERIAARSPVAIAELRNHRRLVPYEYTKGPGRWQVSWFTPPPKQRELLQVYVSDAAARVTEAWSGFQVAWTMARGYPGAFGRKVNSWWLWTVLCLAFVAPFLPVRRPRGRRRGSPEGAGRVLSGRPRPTLLHLDLLVLLSFSLSLAFFNHSRIGLSVPLVYPFLLYLLGRMLLLAFGRGRAREPLRVLVPIPWLVVATVFLIGFRVGLNVSNSNVIDVGYAGVIGADKLINGHPMYGGWPSDNPNGDTYGPVNYYAYVPARAIFGWSGVWDDLPAAHAAALAFDLLTLVGLFFLGRRIRGPSTGVVLAYAWAAYPFTLYTLSSNSNDSLVALVIVVALLVIGSAPARGVAGALAGFTKFAPLALGPLLLRGTGARPRGAAAAAYVLAYAAASAVLFLPILTQHDLHAFWSDAISYQANRGSPFSVWGLWGGLSAEQHLVQGLAVGLAVLVAFVPRRRTLVEVAALGAAVVIALQLGISHWFYLYIPWFFPLVMVALVCSHPSSRLAPALQALTDGEPRPGIPIVARASA